MSPTPQRTVPPLVLITGPEGVLADRALSSILSEVRVTALGTAGMNVSKSRKWRG